MDSGDISEMYVPPFEIVPTSISSGLNTQTISIKTHSSHNALLQELFTRLFNNVPTELAHMQCLLSGISTIIGLKNYQKMIIDNNKYYSTVATIPIKGITPDILDLEIHVDDANDPNKHLALCLILTSFPWCQHIKHTQTPNKILIITTKTQLTNAHQWLNQNLGPLFTKHLPKNPQFRNLLDGTMPCCLDHVLTTAAIDTYAKKLLNTIPAIQETNKKKFAKTPVHQIHQQSTFILNKTQFPPLNNTHKSAHQRQHNCYPTNQHTCTYYPDHKHQQQPIQTTGQP